MIDEDEDVQNVYHNMKNYWLNWIPFYNIIDFFFKLNKIFIDVSTWI
jgi:hypothetical protein